MKDPIDKRSVMDRYTTRRRMLATVGAASAIIAGCLEEDDEGSNSSTGNGDTDSDGGSDENEDEESDEEPDENGDEVLWPAIDSGEVIDDFDDLDSWETINGSVEGSSEEARTGSQAAVLESEDGQAAIGRQFSEPLDLDGWQASMAVKAEAVPRIVIEFIAPNNDRRLHTVRPVLDTYDGWFRLDCGYNDKPRDEPDISEVTQINIIADDPDDEPIRMVVDDLRRTETADNGKAILAFYEGYDSHYEIAAPMLEERGWAGTVPVVPEHVGTTGRMDMEELRELSDRGWDVCSSPGGNRDLLEIDEGKRRQVIDVVRKSLVDQGFEDGARHFFAPEWRRMDQATVEIVRDIHETGFMFGSGPVGAPPTGLHTIPVVWGPALHSGVRRHINLADQYSQLTVLRIPPIVETDPENSEMSLEDFEHLLDHIEHRGLDVITPSDLVDGLGDGSATGNEPAERPDGTIFEEGESYTLEGSQSGESDEFELLEGVLVAEFSHDGDGEFVVEVEPVDGDVSHDVLVDTSANGSGESIVIVDEGTYRLSIDADDWSIDLSQPEVHSDDLEDLPVEASGNGTSFVGPLWTESDVRLTATHDGNEEFRVDGHGADGHRESLIVTDGAFDSSRSYSAGGVVWLTVEADGNWSLELESA